MLVKGEIVSPREEHTNWWLSDTKYSPGKYASGTVQAKQVILTYLV